MANLSKSIKFSEHLTFFLNHDDEVRGYWMAVEILLTGKIVNDSQEATC